MFRRFVWLSWLMVLLPLNTALADCGCGADQCTGTSVTYDAPSWAEDFTPIVFGIVRREQL